MNICGILAGGTGTRMTGSPLPKQFLPVGGVPVIVRTLTNFLDSGLFEKALVVIHPSWVEYARDLLEKHGLLDRVEFALGGPTRFASMENLIEKASEIPGEHVLVVHDCARPFVPKRVFKDLLHAIDSSDMATASLPAVDSMIYSEDGSHSTSMLTRSKVFCDQGPQAFRLSEIRGLLRSLTDEEREAFMEAGALYLARGKTVSIVEGSYLSFKLTRPADLEYAEFLVSKGVIE